MGFGVVMVVWCASIAVAQELPAAPAPGSAPASTTVPAPDPPPAAPTPPLAAAGAPPALSPQALVRFRELALTRTNTRGGWRVVDGRGAELDLAAWTAITGDGAAMAAAQRARAARVRALWGGGGAVALVAGALLLADLGPIDAPAGTDRWETRLGAQDVQAGGAAVLLAAGVGGVVLTLSEVPEGRVRAPLRNWVTPVRADLVVATYNEDLLATLARASTP